MNLINKKKINNKKKSWIAFKKMINKKIKINMMEVYNKSKKKSK
jgi:hypothetical protein